MNLTRPVASIAAVVLAATGIALAAPAQASNSQFPGEANRLNMYEDDSYSGHFEARASYDTDFHNDSFNDQLSSFVNKTDNWWILYENINYGGYRVCVRPHSHDANIGNDTTKEDDISSVKMFGTTKPSGCDDTTGTAN
jgi:hypothetical protein